jgi:hypothetical protein
MKFDCQVPTAPVELGFTGATTFQRFKVATVAFVFFLSAALLAFATAAVADAIILLWAARVLL